MKRKDKTYLRAGQKVTKHRRVRFLSLDYYRTICTGFKTDIVGIKDYYCDDDVINVHYESGLCKAYAVNEGEHQLKEVIKIINAYIGGTGNGAQ